MQDQITTCLVDNDAGVWEARLGMASITYRDNADSKRTALRGIDQASYEQRHRSLT